MSAFALVQGLVLALVLLASLLVTFRKLLPQTAKRMQSRLSAALDRPGRAPLTRRLGCWLQPAEAKGGGCGTGDGCSRCGGCAPAAVPAHDARVGQPLHFRPRHR